MKLTNAELDEILDTAGLRMNQPYNPRGSYRKDEYIFTACKRCGTEAHYRLKYILDKNASCEPVCRACHWLGWYSGAHALYDSAVRRLIEAGATRARAHRAGRDRQAAGPGLGTCLAARPGAWLRPRGPDRGATGPATT
jgi:hypothetical protein